MGNCIEVVDAVKKFKENTALDHVSIAFEKGKIHGIIGRNGSGKTVLFKCICGFMTLDEGRILVNGEPVKFGKAQNMGIMIENPGFIGSMSGYKNLQLLASIHHRITPDTIRQSMELVGLDPDSRKHVRKYSLGMRHRLGIAQAVMEDPDILILDEPMNGLDRNGVKEMRQLLMELRERGKTILLASHYAEDVDVLCDTVCEMDAGKVVQ